MNAETKKAVIGVPYTRELDCTPNKLAAETHFACNTVKRRIDCLDIDFTISADSRYRVYNYECLPILKAFISVPDKSVSAMDDTDKFLERLFVILDREPRSAFCKKYLLGQPAFRNLFLKNKLEEPIAKRLSCIKDLAMRLAVLPSLKTCSPIANVEYASILSYLDEVIFQLSDFAGNDRQEESYEKDDLPTPTDLSKKWCTELIETRKKIKKGSSSKELHQVSDLRTALDNALSNEYFYDSQNESEGKKKVELVEKTSKLIEELDSEIERVRIVPDQDSFLILRSQIQKLMDSNMERYLQSMFCFMPAPDFIYSEDCELDNVVLSAVNKWYGNLVYASSSLYQMIHILWPLRVTCPTDSSLPFLDDILQQAESTLSSFKDVFCEKKYFTVDNKAAEYDEIISLASTVREFLNLQEAQIEDLRNQLLEHPTCQKDRLNDLFLLSTLTMEYFWRKMTNDYQKYIIVRYRCFIEALRGNDEAKTTQKKQ